MKNFYFFLGILLVILLGLSLNEPEEQPAFTELKPKNFFFSEGLSAQSTTHKYFQQKHFLNKVSLIFFGYTRCPDFCPDTLAKLNKIYASMKNNNYENFENLKNHNFHEKMLDSSSKTSENILRRPARATNCGAQAYT